MVHPLFFSPFRSHLILFGISYISQNASWKPPENVLQLIGSSCCVIWVGRRRDEDRKSEGGKPFQLRKSEGHQLLKTQHVVWLHYHIMDYWCDCHWRNCHLCLFCDGFFSDCWMWKWPTAPSYLILGWLQHLKFEGDVLHVFFCVIPTLRAMCCLASSMPLIKYEGEQHTTLGEIYDLRSCFLMTLVILWLVL